MKLCIDVGVIRESASGRAENHHIDCVLLDPHDVRLLQVAIADKRAVVGAVDSRSLGRIAELLEQAVKS